VPRARANASFELGRRRPEIPAPAVEGHRSPDGFAGLPVDFSDLTNRHWMGNTPDRGDFYRVRRISRQRFFLTPEGRCAFSNCAGYSRCAGGFDAVLFPVRVGSWRSSRRTGTGADGSGGSDPRSLRPSYKIVLMVRESRNQFGGFEDHLFWVREVQLADRSYSASGGWVRGVCRGIRRMIDRTT
jgi:hypothetical protein